MLIGLSAVLTAIIYIAALFGVAWFGDRRAARGKPHERPLLYALWNVVCRPAPTGRHCLRDG